jgi:hypothetical protein
VVVEIGRRKSNSGWIRSEWAGLDLNLVMDKGGNAIARRSVAGSRGRGGVELTGAANRLK